MRAEKLRELDENELRTQISDIAEQMFRLRFQLGMGQMDGLKKFRVLKRDRARIFTVLRERELSAAAEAREKEGN
jgi:large subunit ribosomal protein L29